MPSRGRFIVVVGPDGIGKSTLAAEIGSRLGDDSAYFHFLPSPPHRLDPSPSQVGELVEKHEGDGSRVAGILRIVRNLVRSWLGYGMAIRPAVRHGTTVVGDRWLYGYLAQPRALRFYGPQWVARLALSLAPRPDLVVLLEAPADVVYSRKPELSRAEIEQESEVWRDALPMALRLDATQSPGKLADTVLAPTDLGVRFKRYPPGLGHVLLPAIPRRAALAGSSLYAPTRPRGLIAHRAARVLLRAVGTAWLTTARREDAPITREAWAALVASLRAAGIPVDAVAFYGRTQAERAGFSMLTIGEEGATAFVRVADGSALDSELRAISMLEAFQPSSFAYPRLLLRGSHGAFEHAAYSAVLTEFHRPPRRPDINAVIADIQEAFGDQPRPVGTPSHWVPMHGDFAPWNLRELRGKLVLIDWESTGWGPPHADEVFYLAASRALGLPVPAGMRTNEASEFWKSRLGRSSNARDNRLQKALAQALSITDE